MSPSWPPEGPVKVGPDPGTFLLQLCNETLHPALQECRWGGGGGGGGVFTEEWVAASSWQSLDLSRGCLAPSHTEQGPRC